MGKGAGRATWANLYGEPNDLIQNRKKVVETKGLKRLQGMGWNGVGREWGEEEIGMFSSIRSPLVSFVQILTGDQDLNLRDVSLKSKVMKGFLCDGIV